MKVSNLNLCKQEEILRVEARIEWEDGGRPPLNIFLDTLSRFEATVWPDPNAFLLATILPAWHAGEKRVRIEGEICPVLRDNIRAALRTLRGWFPNDFGPMPHIESTVGFAARHPVPGGAISLLSCGIDSLSILRANQLNLPPDHPGAIRAGVMVAFSEHHELSYDLLMKKSAGRLAAAEGVAADAGIDPIPVRTNFWWLDTNGDFYSEKSHGAILSATACFFSRGFSKAYIASSQEGHCPIPWGSHPLLDNYYSSGHFQIHHEALHLTRMEKVSLVADWPPGLNAIRVCQNDNSGSRNCGTCEKCIRTMIALLILGKLSRCDAFPVKELSDDLLRTLDTYNMIQHEYQVGGYREFVTGLENTGRTDLARVLAEVLDHAGTNVLSGAGPP